MEVYGKNDHHAPQIQNLRVIFLRHVKHQVYSDRILNVQHLLQRIQKAVALITPDILENVWRELQHRLDLCRANNRAHVQMPLETKFEVVQC